MHHLQVTRLPCLPRLPHLFYALAVRHVVLAGAYSFFVFFSPGYVYLKMIPQVGQTASRSPKGKVVLMQSFIAQLQIHCCTCGLALEVQANAKERFRKGDDGHCHGKCKQMPKRGLGKMADTAMGSASKCRREA